MQKFEHIYKASMFALCTGLWSEDFATREAMGQLCNAPHLMPGALSFDLSIKSFTGTRAVLTVSPYRNNNGKYKLSCRRSQS